MSAQNKKRKVFTMRKFLAVFLAVMMLAGALCVLPTSAAKAEFDNTDSGDKMDLVVTEVLINSKTGQDSLDNVQEAGSVSKFSSPDAFDYIEIYNRGTTAINLYQLKILSANSKDFTGTSNNSTAEVNEQNKYLFKFQNVLVPGSIHDDNNAANAASGSLGEYNACKNPTTAVLNPGQFAVIWFWTSATDQLCNKLGQTEYPVGAQWEGDSRYFPYFRNYYNISDDVLVVATNAKASNPTGPSSADVYNDLRNGYTYAFAKTGFAFGNKCYTAINGLDSNIMTMFEYATNTGAGIPTTDNMDDVAATYVPSNCSPDLYNTNQSKIVGEGWVDKADYVQISDATVSMGMKYVRSYRECAVVTYTEEPTPGDMPAWQWYYIQPGTVGSHSLKAKEEAVFAAASNQVQADASIEASAKAAKTMELFNKMMADIVTDWATNAAIKDENGRLLAEGAADTNWPAKAKAQFLADYAAEITEEEDNEETKKNYAESFVDREVLMERHQKRNNKPNNTKDSLPGWAIALIIAGCVVFAAGIAVVVILIVKKKKPVADDDVAAEGEVLVIDETAADAEAPVEEAPVENPTEGDQQ